MKTLIIILAVSSNLAWVGAFAVYPFIYVLKTGAFVKGMLYSWSLNFLGVTLMSLFIPAAIASFIPEYKQFIFSCFPEAPGIVGVLFTGWLPALIICGLALVARILIQKYRTRKLARSETDAR